MKRHLLFILFGGMLFGFGLAMSSLVMPEVVLSFLMLDDFGLAVTMLGALAVTTPIYQLAPRLRARPVMGASFDRMPRTIKRENVLGGAVFGIGWGVSGVCPGAGIASLGAGNWPFGFAFAGMLIGAYLQGVAAAHRTSADVSIR